MNRGQNLLTAQATPCPASRLLKVLSFELTGMSCGSEDHPVAVPIDSGVLVVHLSSPSPFEGVPSYLQAYLVRQRSGPANPLLQILSGYRSLKDETQSGIPAICSYRSHEPVSNLLDALRPRLKPG